MTKIQWDYSSILSGLNSENNEEYYYSFIKYESAVRTVHTVFHVVVLLSSLYNIAPSLKIEDMQLDLPNTSVLWNTGNFGEFRSFYNGFAFKPENFQSCLKRLVNLNLQKVELNEPEDGLNEVGGFFFKHHVSDYGLICLQNGLHQMFYYQKLYGTNGSQNITRQNSMNNTFGEPDNNNSYSALEDNFINIAKCWNLMVDQCQLYSSDKEIIIDSKVMNYHLLLKNSLFEINTKFKNNKTFELRLHKLKERVWLKDWHKMSEIFVEDNNDNTNDFLFGFSNDNEKSQEDDSELDDMITEMVQYCILILKEIFFRNNLPTRQEHENINFPAYLQNNRQILRNEIETLLSSLETNLSSASVDDLICNHLLLIKLASLNYQILFDVCIVISKFIRNFEKKYYYDNLKALRYSHSPGVHNDLISKTENGVNKNVIPINEKLFSVYKQLFKIIVIFENYLRLKYDYDNNKEDDDNFNFSNLNLNGDSVKEAQKLNLQQHHNQMNFLFKHDNDNNDMFTGFTYDQSNPPILTSNRNINTSPDELLAQNRSFELLKNLISCKKINNFLIIFKFIFKFIFYENLNYKISCFKNLNNGLDYLNKSLA
ncbi:hypothetical protein PACTADRAFT_47630 [Pachysolen tannophilus NRRL Y-2460]|uniref:Transcription factor domain-containing protein n=1 Tax=Pachysolen tannophilus NRRL Y-2460 TaxID=669874 RepID=A0A1E4U191_PACTA|nr:hypothetical protein PACTADRAFT_47630 [Pachysolen tannophilus NRRL Y-2460]